MHGLIQGSLVVPKVDLGPPQFERVTTSSHQNKQKLYTILHYYVNIFACFKFKKIGDFKLFENERWSLANLPLRVCVYIAFGTPLKVIN